MSLQSIRVVLVNTSHAGNIGGAARAMKNMGLSRLVLVDPEDFPSPNAVARASGATDILDSAEIVATLEEALVGCSLVLGTSARDRRIPWPLLDPRETGTVCLEQVERGGEVALVFGREYAGLTNEELQRCQYHVHIPSDPDFSSLNLAAAVQVLAYEVRMAWLAANDQPTKQEIPNDVLKASKYIADLVKQTSKVGELRGPLQAGVMTEDDVYAELGEVVNGDKPGREGNEIIVVDLTGTGAQDAAIGQVAWDKLSVL